MIQSKPDNRGTRVGSTSYAVGPAGAQAWELEGVQDCHGMTVGQWWEVVGQEEMRLKRLEYPTWFLNCHKESLKNMKRQRDTVRSGLISNYSVLPQIALLCLTINGDIVNRYKLGCLCALLALLWYSVGELGDCQKARNWACWPYWQQRARFEPRRGGQEPYQEGAQ